MGIYRKEVSITSFGVSGSRFYLKMWGPAWGFSGWLPISSAGDFDISMSPSSMSVNRGASTTCTITLTSLGGFASAISLDDSVEPNTNDITLTFDPSPVTLTSGGSAQSTLTIDTTSTTPLKNFKITITASGGGKTKEITCRVSVEIYLEVPYQNQGYAGWCALTSLAMTLRYYGKEFHSWDYAADQNYPTYPIGLHYLIRCDTLADYVRQHYSYS